MMKQIYKQWWSSEKKHNMVKPFYKSPSASCFLLNLTIYSTVILQVPVLKNNISLNETNMNLLATMLRSWKGNWGCRPKKYHGYLLKNPPFKNKCVKPPSVFGFHVRFFAGLLLFRAITCYNYNLVKILSTNYWSKGSGKWSHRVYPTIIFGWSCIPGTWITAPVFWGISPFFGDKSPRYSPKVRNKSQKVADKPPSLSLWVVPNHKQINYLAKQSFR